MIKEGASASLPTKFRVDDEFSARALYFIGEIEMCVASDHFSSVDIFSDDDVSIILIATVAKMEEDMFGDGWDAIVAGRFRKDLEYLAEDLGIGRLSCLHRS